MEEGIIYYPVDSSFSGVEAYCKFNGKLYGIQCSITNENKECSNGALAMFFQKINFPAEKLDIYRKIYVKPMSTNSEWILKKKTYSKK